jgi:hypothetical protein
MAKKVFVVLFLCIVAMCCVYAGKVGFVAQGSPYSTQTVSSSGEKYVSTYGYGFKVGFRYELFNHFTVGLDASDAIYKYKILEYDYLVIGLRAVVGYTVNFNERFFANCEFGAGFSFRSIGEKRQKSYGINVYLGGGFRLSNELALTLGAEMDYGRQSKSTDLAFKSQIGLVLSM